MSLFSRLFPQYESSERSQFRKIYDNTTIPSERVLMLYRGTIPGRSQEIIYQLATIRTILHHRIHDLRKNEPTHEFTCIYRDIKGIYRVLFLFKFDCRLCNRKPDHVAKSISEFLANLLIDVVNSPGSVRNALVSQDSLEYWSEAFQKWIVSLIQTYEEQDKRNSIF